MVDNVKWTRAGRYIATTFRHVIPTLDIQDQGEDKPKKIGFL